MLITILVCLSGQTCDVDHARAYQIFRAPPGIIVCGTPASLPIQNEALLPQENEETHIRCRVGE